MQQGTYTDTATISSSATVSMSNQGIDVTIEEVGSGVRLSNAAGTASQAWVNGSLISEVTPAMVGFAKVTIGFASISAGSAEAKSLAGEELTVTVSGQGRVVLMQDDSALQAKEISGNSTTFTISVTAEGELQMSGDYLLTKTISATDYQGFYFVVRTNNEGGLEVTTTASDFSASENYAVGAQVKYDNKYYVCIKAHNAAGWAAADFEMIGDGSTAVTKLKANDNIHLQ